MTGSDTPGSKNWTSSGAIGPWITTFDEVFGPGSVDDLEDLRLTTTVNGEVRQDDLLAAIKYPIEYQVQYLSTFTELSPGDLVSLGHRPALAPGPPRPAG